MTPEDFDNLSDLDKLEIIDDPSHDHHESLLDFLDPTSSVNAPTSEAPYGFMIDPKTGERRAKKRPGRQRVSPDPEDSEDPPPQPDPAPSESEDPRPDRAPIERGDDRPPSSRRSRGRGSRRSGGAPVAVPRETPSNPPLRAGAIAKGMNKLYRRVGKLVSMADPMIGQAFIEITRKDDEDDVTVGEAWEELARVNPRIRTALNKLLTGSGWGQLAACHLPILLAVAIRTGLVERLNLGTLLSLAVDDEAPSGGGQFDGLTQEDMEEMMRLAAQVMPGAEFPGTVPPPFERGA